MVEELPAVVGEVLGTEQVGGGFNPASLRLLQSGVGERLESSSQDEDRTGLDSSRPPVAEVVGADQVRAPDADVVELIVREASPACELERQLR